MPTGSWIPSGNDTPRLQSRLRNAVSQLAQAAEELQALTNVMAQMAPASDYTTIETYFAIPTGSGQAVHDIVGSANTLLQGATIQALLQRLA